MEFDHRESVVEIFAELAGGHHGFEIAVGCGDDAEGDLFGGVGPDGFDFLLLDSAEEFGLHGVGEVAEFIEEEGAAVGGFEHAFFVVGGTGEGALDMAEHLTFKEGFGDGGAVTNDEGPGVDGALAMEGGGGEFFAGAGGSADEGDAVVGADAADHGEHFEHLGGVSDHAFEAMGVDEGSFEAGGFEAILGLVEELADAGAEVGNVEWFGEVVAGTAADGFDGGFRGVVAGEEENVGRGGEAEDIFGKLEAGAAGEDEIEDDDLGAFGVDEAHGVVAIGGREDAGAEGGEGVGEEFERERIVVDGEDGKGRGQPI